jgi:hypothetical protein
MILFLYFSPPAIHGGGLSDVVREQEGIDLDGFSGPLKELDKIALRGQQEHDVTSIERGGWNGFA